jgi:beta-glucosidase
LFSAKKESYGNFVEQNKQLTLKAAQSSMVLLKNENNLLPLNMDRIKSIAVIGPYGEYPVTGGGGSSRIRPAYRVSLIKGISNLAGKDIKVLFAEGTLVDNGRANKLDLKYFYTHNDCKENGFVADFFPNTDFKGKPLLTKTLKNLDLNLNSFFKKEKLPDSFSVQLSSFMRPPVNKWYEFFITSDGSCATNLDEIYAAGIPKTGFMRRSMGENIYNPDKLYPVIFKFRKIGKNDKLKVEWSHVYNDGKDYLAEAKNVAKKADIVVLTAGFNNYCEGEGIERQRDMPGNQDALIKEILTTNPKTIVVLQSGTPIEIDEWAAKAPAIIQNWYNGQESGNALAQVLFGKINPSGKLPFTWVKKYDDSPTMKDYGKDPTKTEFREGIFMGYRYYDKSKVSVQFPFGHGLSYTAFGYSNLKMKKEFTAKDTLTVTLDIKNTGPVAGKEVVQLYVSEKVCSMPRPVKELKAFSKVELATGESKTVTMKLGKSAFSYYDPSIHDWKAEPGEFEILVGSSLQDIRLSDTVVLQ